MKCPPELRKLEKPLQEQPWRGNQVGDVLRTLLNEQQTIELGQELALFARKGLVICLYGDLGAGKSTMARSFIRALSTQADILDVPSPTFSLVQPYDELRVPVHHFDLYRTHDIDEIYELGLYDDQETRVTLIEWPERIADDLPEDRIEVHLIIEAEERRASLRAFGHSIAVLNRFYEVAEFIDQSGWQGATRCFLQGDASARRYERLALTNGDKAILMDMPSVPDGPTLASGKSYSAIAHIAEGIFPVAAINQGLLDAGYSAPKALHKNLDQGLMLIEDFGNEVYGSIITAGGDIMARLRAATQLLAHMAQQQWPTKINLGKTGIQQLPIYDRPAYEIEVDLLLSWFWPLQKGETPSKQVRDQFLTAWQSVFQLFDQEQSIWVMRDFHSPNLIWLPDRDGHQRVGLIDTQDCVLGHPAYDLVSMLQDARVDLPLGSEAILYEKYCALRLAANEQFNQDSFSAAYAGLGAQRATKILGIFARLYVRDKKSAYLKHLPRVSAYLEHNLRHPALKQLAAWFDTYLPLNERVYSGSTL